MKRLHDSARVRQAARATRERVLEQLFEAALILADAMDRGLEERGLTRARAEVVRRLEAAPLNQRELSRALRCTPRNVTGLVDALEAAGLVARGPQPGDRRAFRVTLTRKGERVAATMRADQRRAARSVLGGLRDDELAPLASVLARVRGGLGAP